MISLFLLALTSADLDASPIHLTCLGNVGRDTEGSNDLVEVVIDGQNSRLRAPHNLLPTLHGGGDNGWYPLEKVKIEPSTIRASVSFGWRSHPKVFIDRQTGSINVDGSEVRFSGKCEKRVNDQPNRF